MKMLSGTEIADYMKENQAHMVRSLKARKIFPKLVIIRDSNNPVITKYVNLKQQYGSDIGIEVEDCLAENVSEAIEKTNLDVNTHGIIVQLPMRDMTNANEVLAKIDALKDVDGLANGDLFESATATAINWLMAGYDIDLSNMKIALVGRGRLVGGPLARMWTRSGYDVVTFGRDSDLDELKKYDLIVSATGVPHLITDEMVKTGAVVVDAGTASEGGVLIGDVDESVRRRNDLTAITPKIGGVGPLTVTALFEHVLMAANAQTA